MSAICSTQNKEVNPKTEAKNFSNMRKYVACGIPLPFAAKFVAVLGIWFFCFVTFSLMGAYFGSDYKDGNIILESRNETEIDGDGVVHFQTVNRTTSSDAVLFMMVYSALILVFYIALNNGIHKSNVSLVFHSSLMITFLQFGIQVMRMISMYNVVIARKEPPSKLPGFMEYIIIYVVFPYSTCITYCYFKEEIMKLKLKIEAGKKVEKVDVNEV